MENKLQLFQFNSQPVRVVWVGNDPMPVFVDTCKILERSNPSEAVKHLLFPDGVSQTYLTDSLGRKQLTTIISLPNYLDFVARSETGPAIEFRKWVWGEVMPAILKTGSYSMNGVNFDNLIELDPCKVKDNKKLLRRIVMLYEDVILGLQEKLGLYKRLEKHYHPEQAITRGKREVTAINVFATDEKMKHLVFKIFEEEVVVQTTFLFEDEESA